MDKMNETFQKIGRNQKGMGLGATALLVAGGFLYAGAQSLFTGKFKTGTYQNCPKKVIYGFVRRELVKILKS